MDSRPSSRFIRYFVGLTTLCLGGWLAGQIAKTDSVGLALTVEQPQSPQTGEVIGTPSPRNANYSIDVRLDPGRRTLTGRETVTWRNIANIATKQLQFHLYYNAWKNTQSTWMRERLLGRGNRLHGRTEDAWGWIEITAVRLLSEDPVAPVNLTQEVRYISPDDGNLDDQTVLAIDLPNQVEPGETVTLEIEWASRIPKTFARTGAIGDYFFIAQWFPKIGVLEDTGWNCHQFHASTEFFSDYGVYDVRITVPQGWTVGATGAENGRADNDDGTTTHSYHQEDVHDFAWVTSPDLIDLWDHFTHPDLPDVAIRLLIQPEHVTQASRYFEATRKTLQYYGEWFGAYPYGHVTVVDPAWQSGSGGMEYPTFFTGGTRWLAPNDVATPEAVTVHEAGHQFWYGAVGNNEFEHAWLDEGLTTFATARVLEESFNPQFRAIRFFGGFVPWVVKDIPWSRTIDGDRVTGYRRNARQDPQSTPTFQYWPGTAGSITYDKTALWLHTLERHLGWETLRRGMSAFYEEWRFAHPEPADFFRAISDASEQDLSWFFDQAHGEASTFDYGIDHFTSRQINRRGLFGEGQPSFEETSDAGMFETTVVVRRYGDGTFPVDILTEFQDGSEVRETWEGTGHWKAFTYVRDAKATRAFVDPDRVLLLDTQATNNSQTTTPMGERAAKKWSLTWLVWLQDLLLTYGFFI